jgi:DNA repair photolyase
MGKPVSGTGEWASSNVNIQFGCPHNCKNWHKPISRQKNIDKRYGKRQGTIMFPTTHDITPENIDDVITVLGKLLKAGNQLLIVSKPHISCIETICANFNAYKDRVLFRFTIGSADDKVLSFWEPDAPSYNKRVNSLKYAYEHGWETSVSCEPMLDLHIVKVVRDVEKYVTDAIWLGKMNSPMQRVKINGYTDEETIAKVKELMDWQCDENIKALYEYFKYDPKIKWKESIKKVVGLDIPTEKGLDI